MSQTFPTLFVSHGAPDAILHPGAAEAALAAFAARLPRPRAVLVASAHWDTEAPALGGSAAPATIHDFGGFPEALYRMRYPAPGDPDLAAEARALLAAAALPAVVDARRGLDHGAWTPLMSLYPDADIPVVPLAIQSHLGPAHQLQLGRALAPLARRGVLVLASGNLTHNLSHWHHAQRPGVGQPEYVAAFQDWTRQALESGDEAALLDYRKRAPGARDAHPTDEHWQPLYVALGAAGPGCRVERLYEGVADKVLAMDSYAFHPAGDGAGH